MQLSTHVAAAHHIIHRIESAGYILTARERQTVPPEAIVLELLATPIGPGNSIAVQVHEETLADAYHQAATLLAYRLGISLETSTPANLAA